MHDMVTGSSCPLGEGGIFGYFPGVLKMEAFHLVITYGIDDIILKNTLGLCDVCLRILRFFVGTVSKMPGIIRTFSTDLDPMCLLMSEYNHP